MQTFLRNDACKISNRETVRAKTEARVVAREVYADGDHVHLPLGDAQVARHESGIVIAYRNEGIHRIHLRADQVERLRAPRFTQSFEKQVLALQGTDNRAAQFFLERPRERDEQ